jgi:hypothetical protein
MGIEVSSKQIDTRKLLIDKGVKSDTQGNTGDVTEVDDKTGLLCQANKTVVGTKKPQEKRERTRVYQVNPKSMKKLCDTLAVKPQPDEPANDKPSPQGVPTYDEPPIEAYAQYTLDDIEHLEFTPDDKPVLAQDVNQYSPLS